MKQKINFLLILCLVAVLSSCNRNGKKIYTVVPDDVSVIGSFSPGKLMEKADAADLNFMQDVLGEKEFNKFLYNNPGISGIDVNAYSCGFVYGTETKYMGIVMPLKSKKVFEKFLESLAKEYGTEFPTEITEKYSFSKNGRGILAWNKSILVQLSAISGNDDIQIDQRLNELFSLEAENCILSDRDFNSFLDEQKDLNLWMSSNQLASLGNGALGMMNMLGAINNNYAHFFMEFGKGEINISSNLIFNPDFKKNFDKYNFIDLNAEKEILKMLPSGDLILAGNVKMNPEKMISLFELIGAGKAEFLGEVEKETGKKPNEILNTVQGSFAFSVNGIIPQTNSESDTLACPKKSIPIMVAAMKLNDEKGITDFLKLSLQNKTWEEKDGYFAVHTNGLPFFILIKDMYLIISNEEKYLPEIIANGKLENNLFKEDLSKTLSEYPICMYLNLDRDSYSDKVRSYLNEEMEHPYAKGMKGMGASMKSLTLSGKIEKSEIRIEFKDKEVNALHGILKSLDGAGKKGN